jgi:hypothetical protein
MSAESEADANPGGLRRARRGFAEALGRLAAAYEQADPPDKEGAYLAIVEAAMWASALDEHLSKRDGAVYERRRDAHEHGRCLLGLRVARNRHAHELTVTTAEHLDGVRLPVYLPFRLGGWSWLPTEQMPPSEKPQNPHCLATYDEELAERQCENTLERIRSFLDECLGQGDADLPAV